MEETQNANCDNKDPQIKDVEIKRVSVPGVILILDRKKNKSIEFSKFMLYFYLNSSLLYNIHDLT